MDRKGEIMNIFIIFILSFYVVMDLIILKRQEKQITALREENISLITQLEECEKGVE